MKITRRSFMKLIPAVGVVVAGSALWFLAQTTREQITSQVARTTTTGFEFPITWNEEEPSAINPNVYRLKIDGYVSHPLELELEELYGMTGVQKTLKIRCVEGWEADVPWEGIPLSYLLKQAGWSPNRAGHVTVTATTGYSTTLSSDEAANLDNMIALKVGGAPLTIDHGYPARFVVPSRRGEDWVKCVSRITVTSN